MAILVLLTMGLAAPGAIAQLPGGTLDPATIEKYAIPLVIPPVMNNKGMPDDYDIAVRQFQQQILPGGIWNTLGFTEQDHPATTVWSYGPAADPLPDSSALGGGVGIAPAPNSQFNYPAYTIETESYVPVSVRWRNELREDFGTGDYLSHLLPIDQTLHWANPERDCRDGSTRTDCSGQDPTFYDGPVPIVTHLHGAHVDPDSDGYPEAWWLPAAAGFTACTSIDDETPGCYVPGGTLFDDALGQGRFANTGYADYHYRQDQPATTLWYHDHSLGMTRSNVYAGPAGFWLIRGGMYDKVKVLNSNNRAARLPAFAPAMGQSVLELNLPTNIRKRVREIPIVIQDRSFNVDGSLFYPDNRAFFEGLAPEGTNEGEGELQIDFVPDSDIAPIWNPEAFFNVMVVNGVAWPNLDVAPAKYRFRFLNGCNSRFLILWLVKATDPGEPTTWQQVSGAFWQIGAEQGFLPQPVQLNELLMGLAERADVIVDFEGIELEEDQGLYLVNVGPDEPFGGGIPGSDFVPADPGTTGQVMRFTLNSDLLVQQDRRTTDPADYLLNAEPGLGGSTVTRTLSLNEGESEMVCVEEDENGNLVQVEGTPPNCPGGSEPFGPKEALLGIVDAEGFPVPLKWTDTTAGAAVNVTLTNGTVVPVWVTENPTVGDIEEWEIYNVTADAHPIHLHLVRFQVVDRQGLSLDEDDEVVLPIQLDGDARDPEPWETGFKDTVISYPGEVIRLKALFDIEGLYVWHCHIVEHEDNEMMRPFVVSN
jgi:FtsP/CotA-like multicopper oxidase with cupredoxin domain